MEDPNTNLPAATSAPTPTPPPSPTERPWFENRIDGLTREKYELSQKLQMLEEENKKLRVTPPAATPAPTVMPAVTQAPAQTKEEFEKAVAVRAAEEVAIQNFNAKCTEIYNAGTTAHTDFQASINSFSKLGGLTIPFIEASFELDNPSEVIYELSKNLDKASEIFKLPPVKQALALQKFANELNAASTGTKVPPPIKTVVGAGGGRGDPDPEKMSYPDWLKWREKQLEGK